MSAIQFRSIDSPVGLLTLAGRDGRLMHLRMVDQTYEPSHDGWESDDDGISSTPSSSSSPTSPASFSTSTSSSTWSARTFQRSVWAALLTIPYGETRSYGEIAAQIGSPAASRAVGLANGHNPIGIIVPCHRVIGANGSLTGYGGGLDRKRALLALEKSRNPVTPTLFD